MVANLNVLVLAAVEAGVRVRAVTEEELIQISVDVIILRRLDFHFNLRLIQTRTETD